MKTGFAKKAARIILVVLLALIWTQAPAAEMTDQEIRDYLVAKSPFKGYWSSGHPWSGTLAQRFWVKDEQFEGALTEWNYDTQRGMDYSGPALNLVVKDGRISFSTTDGVKFDMQVKKGELVGTAFRTQYSKIKLSPAN